VHAIEVGGIQQWGRFQITLLNSTPWTDTTNEGNRISARFRVLKQTNEGEVGEAFIEHRDENGTDAMMSCKYSNMVVLRRGEIMGRLGELSARTTKWALRSGS
jgi:hypothetical protein